MTIYHHINSFDSASSVERLNLPDVYFKNNSNNLLDYIVFVNTQPDLLNSHSFLIEE